MSGQGPTHIDGLVTHVSAFSTAETTRRLLAAIEQRGLTIFARIDHAKNAASVNMPLRPTQVIIFGAAKGGTPLMQDQQTSGLDLPLKVLVWEDAAGKTLLTYNDPAWIAQRHRLGAASAAAVNAMAGMLDAMVREAAGWR